MPTGHGAHYGEPVTGVTVFGAGAMGTAFAMHAARRGLKTSLWANEFDSRALESIRRDGRHPLLPEHVPTELRVFAPDELKEAADGCEIAVLAANSHGARSLARMVVGVVEGSSCVISVAKGLETSTGKRISEVYTEELPGATVIGIGGPCLATELAEGLPCAAVWASTAVEEARGAGSPFEHTTYQITYTDDLAGVEYCSMMKNVAAIGLGMLDGLGKPTGEDFKNAKAALFTKAAQELATLVITLGGQVETALGLAGLGDALVTSLGGRNRLYGELVGAGNPPEATLTEMEERGMTVEGVDSTRDVQRLARQHILDLPYHLAIYRVLFEGADPRDVLEVLR
jgi:glycerol-3-phosphate dehydrogenase (NAD(P)+)